MTMVRFTRCLYAMLASQRFEPPKVFAPYIPPEEHPDHHAHVLGMKLVCALLSWFFRTLGVILIPLFTALVQACGFEILYDIKRKSKADEAAATAVHDVKVPRALTFNPLTKI